MDVTSPTTIQQRLDAEEYPPTMQYDIATLTPRGPLVERLRAIGAICPSFFRAHRFLDVGASKGYFTLRAARTCAHVTAVEPNAGLLGIWAPLTPANVECFGMRFEEYVSFHNREPRRAPLFDMVWVGNVHHYLARANALWLTQLANLASDRMVIEGPVGAACPDFAKWPKGAGGIEAWPPGTVPEEKAWVPMAEALGYELVGRIGTTSYTPGRAIWFLRWRQR